MCVIISLHSFLVFHEWILTVCLPSKSFSPLKFGSADVNLRVIPATSRPQNSQKKLRIFRGGDTSYSDGHHCITDCISNLLGRADSTDCFALGMVRNTTTNFFCWILFGRLSVSRQVEVLTSSRRVIFCHVMGERVLLPGLPTDFRRTSGFST